MFSSVLTSNFNVSVEMLIVSSTEVLQQVHNLENFPVAAAWSYNVRDPAHDGVRLDA